MIHFDTSPRTVNTLNKLMRQDPMVIRWTVLKVASKVEDLAEEGRKLTLGEENAKDALKHMPFAEPTTFFTGAEWEN